MEGGIFLLSREEFIRNSLEINLFFQRIIKEHLFFIETNLQAPEAEYIAEASRLKRNFEQLLSETVNYARRISLSRAALNSNEFVTPYTLRTERLTSQLTGANIDTEITRKELELLNSQNYYYTKQLENNVQNLNARTLDYLEEVIAFQIRLMNLLSRCEIFITLYDELLEHLTQETEYYQETLRNLQNRRMPERTLCVKLNFWNNIMGEHAQFIDGMLDPTEKNLKETARMFAERFEILVERCIREAEREILRRSLTTTEKIRGFKRAATEGLLDCEIKSIIPPLLADHVLREANHYFRILRERISWR